MICVSVGEKERDKVLEIILKYSFAEVRIDMLEKADTETVKHLFSSHPNLIATFRKKENCYEDIQRLDCLKTAVESGASYADTDINNTDQFVKTVSDFCCGKAKHIISFHDFRGTPDYNILYQIIDKACLSGADIVKIACCVSSVGETERLLSLPSVFPGIKIAVAGMGRYGERVRILAPFAGSVFTYASSVEGSPTSSGQIDYYNLAEKHMRLRNVW